MTWLAERLDDLVDGAVRDGRVPARFADAWRSAVDFDDGAYSAVLARAAAEIAVLARLRRCGGRPRRAAQRRGRGGGRR